MLEHPITRIFTTFILSLMLITPLIDKTFLNYADTTVIVVYILVAIFILGKVIYQICKSKK